MADPPPALLSWGFIVEEDQVLALLKAFQKDGPGEGEPTASGSRIPLANTLLKPDEVQVLRGYIKEILDKTEFDGFRYHISNVDTNSEEDKAVTITFYTASSLGSRRYSTTELLDPSKVMMSRGLGHTLNRDHIVSGMEGKVKKLQDALPFDQAGIEAPIEQFIEIVQKG